MTNFPAPYSPTFAGPEGVWNADPVEVAARLFVHSFTSLASSPLPQREVGELYDHLATLGGYQLPAARVPTTQPLALTVQLVQEAILTWERAQVATRLSAGSVNVSHTVTVLRFGPAILSASDPVAALRARLS